VVDVQEYRQRLAAYWETQSLGGAYGTLMDVRSRTSLLYQELPHMNTFNGVQWSGWSAVPSRETRSGATTLVPDAAVAYYGNLYLFRVDPNDHKHYVNVLGQVRSTL
jgi:hypothetical protein